MTIVVDASVALRWCFQLNGSDRAEELLRSHDHLIAPDLVIAEITNAAWKFVTFDRTPEDSAISAVCEVAKAFEELVPMNVLKDRALAIAIECVIPPTTAFIWHCPSEAPHHSSLPMIDLRRCADTPFEKLVQSAGSFAINSFAR